MHCDISLSDLKSTHSLAPSLILDTNMASAAPISEVLIDVDKAAVDKMAPTKAAIDRGCSLSKFLYIAKEDASNSKHYTFRCALFGNSDFEGALYFLKEKALLPSAGKLRVTGAGCDMYKELIGQVLGLEVEFISEFTTIYRGPHFLLTHAISPESLFYPQINLDSLPKQQLPPEIEERIRKRREEITKNNPKDGAQLPAVFVLFGSACGIMFIKDDGSTQLLGGSMLAGRALLGLGQALAGTSDYEELMQLAASGNSSNIDTTVGEFLKSDPSSNYGLFPKEMPLFSFGKLADSDKSLADFSQEDRAAAVVRMTANNLVSLVWTFAQQCSVSHVIFGGNGVSAEVMREKLSRATRVYGPNSIELSFLRTGHTGAFGAMVASPDDIKLVK